MIINRSDKFGLAQLHQLRGRVGRSHHQAYAYLLLDEDRKITSQAKKRLEAIQLLEDLGSGYYLAIHDLEIRGAGELLGDNQSGQIHEIGFNLYIDMLNHAVKNLKHGKTVDINDPIKANKDINLHTPTILTNDFCPDTNERLILYKRLSSCHNSEQLKEIEEEIIDRFGILPEQTQNLMLFHQLRIFINDFDVIKIDAGSQAIDIQFKEEADIDPVKFIELIQSDRCYKMNGPNRLKVMTSYEKIEERIKFIKSILKKLI
jgi:transcription-repair coupling factor (superfamily II helicase)